MSRPGSDATLKFKQQITDLASALHSPDIRQEAVEALRGLISEVRMVPDLSCPNNHRMDLVGDFAGILQLSEGDRVYRRSANGLCSFGSVTLVAGVGFEPTTFRL